MWGGRRDHARDPKRVERVGSGRACRLERKTAAPVRRRQPEQQLRRLGPLGWPEPAEANQRGAGREGEGPESEVPR